MNIFLNNLIIITISATIDDMNLFEYKLHNFAVLTWRELYIFTYRERNDKEEQRGSEKAERKRDRMIADAKECQVMHTEQRRRVGSEAHNLFT